MRNFYKPAIALTACLGTAIYSAGEQPTNYETLPEFIVAELQDGVPVDDKQPAALYKYISASAVLEDFCNPSTDTAKELDFLVEGSAADTYLQVSAVVLEAVQNDPSMCDLERAAWPRPTA